MTQEPSVEEWQGFWAPFYLGFRNTKEFFNKFLDAANAGLSRESLYRALSPKGNPTLKTLVAVLKAVGLRLTVTEKQKVQAEQRKAGKAHAAA